MFLISREHAWGGKKLNELIQPAFDGRYVLLLMALFSIYVGEYPSSPFTSVSIAIFAMEMWRSVSVRLCVRACGRAAGARV